MLWTDLSHALTLANPHGDTMTSDIATSPRPGIPKRSQPGEISSKVRAVLELMVEEGLPWDEAARSLGISARSMRRQLERPAVIQALKRRREVFRASASAANIKHLVELRGQRTNLMAATKAIQLLEGIGEDAARDRGIQQAPGLVVVIQGGPTHAQSAPQPVVIDQEREPDPPAEG
jgi:Sigma-70, region 4